MVQAFPQLGVLAVLRIGEVQDMHESAEARHMNEYWTESDEAEMRKWLDQAEREATADAMIDRFCDGIGRQESIVELEHEVSALTALRERDKRLIERYQRANMQRLALALAFAGLSVVLGLALIFQVAA
jgi:hypothetical protein